MTDTVNVPREWLEEMAGYLGATDKNDWSGLKPDDAMRGSYCLRVGALMELRAMLADAPKAECELETQEREEEALRDQIFAHMDRLFDIARPEASKVFSCVSCEGRPAHDNNPCSSCGASAPKVEREPCYECGSDVFITSSSIDRACAICNPDLNPAPASDEMLEAAEYAAERFGMWQAPTANMEHALSRLQTAILNAKHKGPQS